MMNVSETRIAVIGLGYVGLPLARLFSTKFPTVGYDMNAERAKSSTRSIWKLRSAISKPP